MKSTTKARRLPADLQTAVDTQFQRSNNKARRPYEHNLLTSAAGNAPSMTCAAKNTPSMAWIAILAASLAYITILAASLVNRAQLAASLAALFRQHPLGSAKVIKEHQVSHSKTKPLV